MAENEEILHDFSPLVKVHKGGRIERLKGEDFVSPTFDPITGVISKDVQISPERDVSARIFRPGNAIKGHKLPLLVYFHGGGFVISSPFNLQYHRHLNHLVSKANVVAVSVNYKLAPEYPLPAAYDDSWTAVEWIASEAGKEDEWLKDYADFDRVYFGGDSAGGNIVHKVALQAGLESLSGLKLIGIFLNCPYFSGEKFVGGEGDGDTPIAKNYGDRLWAFISPNMKSLDEPWINPAADENFRLLGCRKVLIYVAENDFVKHRGWYYKEALENSGWKGEVECIEVAGEGHVFSVYSPDGENGRKMLEKVSSFINSD